MRKVVSMLVLFLLMVGGQLILTSDQTNASCCPPWKTGCHTWSGLVYGSIDLQAPGNTAESQPKKARIKIDDAQADVEVAPDVIDAFNTEKLTKDFGFIILNSSTGTLKIIAFVPIDRNHKGDDFVQATEKNKFPAAQKFVTEWNKLFKAYVAGDTTSS
jgi:hypothetical protein